jgi:hypothetical protein
VEVVNQSPCDGCGRSRSPQRSGPGRSDRRFGQRLRGQARYPGLLPPSIDSHPWHIGTSATRGQTSRARRRHLPSFAVTGTTLRVGCQAIVTSLSPPVHSKANLRPCLRRIPFNLAILVPDNLARPPQRGRARRSDDRHQAPRPVEYCQTSAGGRTLGIDFLNRRWRPSPAWVQSSMRGGCRQRRALELLRKTRSTISSSPARTDDESEEDPLFDLERMPGQSTSVTSCVTGHRMSPGGGRVTSRSDGRVRRPSAGNDLCGGEPGVALLDRQAAARCLPDVRRAMVGWTAARDQLATGTADGGPGPALVSQGSLP